MTLDIDLNVLLSAFVDALPDGMTIYRSRQDIPQNAAPPYLLVELGPGAPRDNPDRLHGLQSRARLVIHVRYLAATATHQRDMASEVQAAVVNRRLVVPGYTCWPVRLINARSLDDGQNSPPVTGGSYPRPEWLEEYILLAEPAPIR